MPSKQALLKAELLLPAYDGMTDAAIASAINQQGSGADVLHDIDVGDLERYMAAEGILTILRDLAAPGATGDASAIAVARELIALFDSVNVNQFNVHHPRAVAGLAVLEAAAIISTAQHAAINALGITAQTRGQEIGVGLVTIDDITRARTL